MHGNRYLRTKARQRFRSLGGIHGVAPAHGQQRHIAANVVHLGNQVGVARMIDASPLDRHHIAHMARLFRVIGLVGVVCRHHFDGDIADLQRIARCNDAHIARNLVGAYRGADNDGVLSGDTGDILRREVIVMIVADENQIGGGGLALELPGVEIDHRIVSGDAKAGMAQPLNAFQHDVPPFTYWAELAWPMIYRE